MGRASLYLGQTRCSIAYRKYKGYKSGGVGYWMIGRFPHRGACSIQEAEIGLIPVVCLLTQSIFPARIFWFRLLKLKGIFRA